MMRFLILSAVLFFSVSCFAREVYRDASGRMTGSGTQQGNRTVYRDASGRVTGSATVQGNRTVYRDASGRLQGTKR